MFPTPFQILFGWLGFNCSPIHLAFLFLWQPHPFQALSAILDRQCINCEHSEVGRPAHWLRVEVSLSRFRPQDRIEAMQSEPKVSKANHYRFSHQRRRGTKKFLPGNSSRLPSIMSMSDTHSPNVWSPHILPNGNRDEIIIISSPKHDHNDYDKSNAIMAISLSLAFLHLPPSLSCTPPRLVSAVQRKTMMNCELQFLT